MSEKGLTLGQWNAYVAAAKTKDERDLRLAEVPVDMKDQVISHLESVDIIQDKDHWIEKITAGSTREERARLLDQVPEHIRQKVEGQVRVIFSVRAFHKRNKRRRNGR